MAKAQSSDPSRSPGRRRAWGSLSRDEIVRVARRVAERDGLQKLSLTRLGKQLQAGPTSLYWYFPSMDDLVTAIADEVSEEMYLRLPLVGDGLWDEEIIDHHLALRRLLQRTPIYREVFAYRAQNRVRYARMPPFILGTVEANVALLVRGGMTPDDAVRTSNVLSAFTRAFVLSEYGLHPEGVDPAALDLVGAVMAQAMPGSPAMNGIDFSGFARLDDSGYRLGLELLVEGARHRYLGRPTAPSAPAPRKRTASTSGRPRATRR